MVVKHKFWKTIFDICKNKKMADIFRKTKKKIRIMSAISSFLYMRRRELKMALI